MRACLVPLEIFEIDKYWGYGASGDGPVNMFCISNIVNVF